MAADSRPRLDLHGAVVYFIDASGARWRVYDTAFGPPLAALNRYAILPQGDRWATARVFIPPEPDAMRRSYRFQPADDRRLTLEVVAAQFGRASYFRRAAPREPEPPAPYLGG